ncbi:alpha/beta hydrolase [Pseudofrankia sp. DC12]|uniref:alpha/beta hydrolase n=1 Tax=Pseudofrankia sp. DC12 TaxID=683315 RepID=UPI0005F82511|nr:alpha/beta hydrolase [Pseudofrankia sp. DC12]
MAPIDPSRFPFALLAPPDPAALPLPPAAYPVPGVRQLRGAIYALPEGQRPLELDLWLPDGTPDGAPPPLVVFVHGGAWRMGRRDTFGPRFRAWQPDPFARLAQAGLAVASPSYRLSGEATYPAQRDDLAAALAWLHTRAKEIGLDTSRTVLWGEAAGGHLAALIALTLRGAEDTATITGCVTWYASSDLNALAADHPDGVYDAHDPHTFEARLLGAPAGDDPAFARDASPVSHVTPDAPPFLILHGTEDALVPSGQSVRLAEALREAGTTPDLLLIKGGNHLWVGLPDAGVEEVFNRTLDFIVGHTRPAGA